MVVLKFVHLIKNMPKPHEKVIPPLLNPRLESTDAASDAVARVSHRVCIFFFFSRIRTDSARFAPMRLDSCRIGFDSRRTGLIRPKSSRIGHIGSYRPAVDTADSAETGQKTAEICRKRPKSALNMAGKSETCILLSFFWNQGIVCVF